MVGPESVSFDALEGHRYVSLTTYRQSGEGVPTPVWFALVGDRAYVYTGLESGKVKRIRHTPRVLLAPSDARGRAKGESVEAVARLVDGSGEEEVADRALREKYTWQYRGFRFLIGLRANPADHVFLELRPAEE